MRPVSTGLLLASLLISVACRPAGPAATATETSLPATATQQPLSPATPLPTPTPTVPDSGWQTIRPGLERRVINLVDDAGEWLESITILRLEPDTFRFEVAYRPGHPQSLSAWQEETAALLAVNGGFFNEEDAALGLIVSQGQVSGSTFQGFGGMFGVTAAGPFLRSLTQEPYRPGEPLLAAVQSFPMLVAPGGLAVVSEEDGQQARRSVVAQDGQDRILFLIAAHGHFTLYQLSRYLVASDLDVDRALNLDGGKSSGLLLADPYLYVPSFTLLPAVITVRAR